MIQVALPWVFLLLLTWLLLPRGRGWRWRFAASLLLITALAQPSVRWPGQHLTLLVDVSESVGDNALTAATQFDLGDLDGDPRLLLFAGDTREVERLDPLQTPSGDLESNHTDLARALQVARAGGGERILLISSGIESRGSALGALPDVPVDVHRVATVENTRITELLAPNEVNPGETVQVVAVIESDRETELTLTPQVGEEVLELIQTRVPAGQSTVAFDVTAAEVGVLRLGVGLEVAYTQPTADDTQHIDIAVTEGDPVLVIGDPAVAELLETQGFRVVEGRPEDVRTPLNYAAVVVRADAQRFSSGQLTLLRDYVEGGGGLMMSGGPQSFGFSGWQRTPVETVLPVDSDLPTETETPQVAIVMVMDRSGSMRAENPSRMSLARQGAIDLIAEAHQDDLLGLVVFDHDYRWVFRPRRATPRGKLEMTEAVRRVQPEGGTIVGPAYQEALAALRETDAAVKHIILLSDGDFYDGTGLQGASSRGPRPDFEGLAAEGLQDNITTTTIGIGEADAATLEQMAATGGGRYYGVSDTSDLPRIFTSEVVITQRATLREEVFSPTRLEHPLTTGLGTPPALDAYIASTLKEGSETLLDGLAREPVLAVGRYGLGRSAALMTDLNGWTGAFGNWNELPNVLGTVVRWLQARPEPYSATVRAHPRGVQVVVDAVRDGAYLDTERLTARYGAHNVRLEQTAPGRYEGVLDTPAQGGSVLVLRGNETVTRAPVTLPMAALDTRGAAERLRTIAQLTGGQVIEAPGPYAPPNVALRVALWPFLAAAGGVLFVLELLARRVGFRRLREGWARSQ